MCCSSKQLRLEASVAAHMAPLVEKLIPEQLEIQGNVFIHKPVMISCRKPRLSEPGRRMRCNSIVCVGGRELLFHTESRDGCQSPELWSQGLFKLFFSLLASMENADFKPTLCRELLLSQCTPRDSTCEMRWN